MDYKELIERLRASNRDSLVSSEETATAIETLLAELDAAQSSLRDLQATFDMYGGEYGITKAFRKAEERDAAVYMLHGECHACKHNAGWHNIGKCGVCMHETEKNSTMEEKRTDCWQWIGPQKEDKHEVD